MITISSAAAHVRVAINQYGSCILTAVVVVGGVGGGGGVCDSHLSHLHWAEG